jgi:hypothetical protein
VRISKSSKASYLGQDQGIIWSRSRRSQGTLSQANEELLVPRTEIITSAGIQALQAAIQRMLHWYLALA